MLHAQTKGPIALLCHLLLTISIASCGASIDQSAQPSVYALIQANAFHPPHRAIALAEDPGGEWAGGHSWNASTEQEAINLALAKCEEARRQSGTRNPCKVYSVNGETSYGKQQPVALTAQTARHDVSMTQTQFVLENASRPPNRAIALANHPGGEWSGGQSWGESTEREAANLALARCEQERLRKGAQGNCSLYSVNGLIPGTRPQPVAPPTPEAARPRPETRQPPPPAPNARNILLTGTGFAVTDDGFILTANHLIEDANAVTVLLANGVELEAKVVKVSRNMDLALLKIDRRTPDCLPIASTQPRVASGDRVFTFGFPVVSVLGIEPKFSDGAISSLSGPGGEITFLQITVPVQPGNSGGPLVSEQGEVVGIITASAAIGPFMKASGTLPQNVNWAVNATFASPLVPKMATQKQMPVKRKEIIERVRKSVVLIGVLKADPG